MNPDQQASPPDLPDHPRSPWAVCHQPENITMITVLATIELADGKRTEFLKAFHSGPVNEVGGKKLDPLPDVFLRREN